MKAEIEIIKNATFSNTYKEEVNYTLGCNTMAIEALSFNDLVEIRNTLTRYINQKQQKQKQK